MNQIYVYFLAFSLLASPLTLQGSKSTEKAFTEIYSQKKWGVNAEGKGWSGPGSDAEATETYRKLLQDVLKAYDIHSVVDVGCGDWEFSRLVNWEGIQYVGYDVVKPVVRANQKKFGSDTITFVHGDAMNMNLPKADLLICKEVLQHLPHKEIQKLINQIHKFKYCLITNDADPKTLSSVNSDLSKANFNKGFTRLLDLTAPPFNLKGEKVLHYFVGPFMKQVLLVNNTVQ